MAQERKAAIDPDELGAKQLSQITAAEFLTALSAGGVLQRLAFWPEKKKVELELDPVVFGRIRVGDIIGVIRGEKKKYEREVGFTDVGFVDPARFEMLVDRVVREVEMRLRK